MSWRSGTEVVIDILCRVPPLLVLDKIFCFRFDDDAWQQAPLQEIFIWVLCLCILGAGMVVLFFLPIQQLQEAYSYVMSLGLLVLSHWWSTKIIAPGSTTFTLNLNYNSSGSPHPLADDPSTLMASAVVQISLAQLFIALRTSRPSYQQVENNNRMALVVQLLLYLSFTLPLTHAVLHRFLPDSIPLTLLLSSLLPFLLLVADWVNAFLVWALDLPRALKLEIATLQAVGVSEYLSNQWDRLQVPHVLRTLFIVRLLFIVGSHIHDSVYHHFVRTAAVDFSQWEANWELAAHMLARSCETWVSLLGFSAMLSLASAYLGVVVGWMLGSDTDEEHRTVGTITAVLFFILALQTGLTGMEAEKRLVRLYRNFCLLSTAILHFIHSMVSPLLMNASASRSVVVSNHVRPLAMCVVLVVCPLLLLVYLWQQHTMSTWLLAVSAFCVEIIIKVFISLTVYTLFMIDAYKETFWEKLDDYVYYVQSTGSTIEFLFGIFLFCNGAWIMLFESGGAIRALMMCIHAYFNIWLQAREGWRVFINRRRAVARIETLDEATQEQLDEHGDVCAICYQELTSARITRCKHFFHAVCLRKWLYVQDRCPLCHMIICSDSEENTNDDTADGAANAAEMQHNHHFAPQPFNHRRNFRGQIHPRVMRQNNVIQQQNHIIQPQGEGGHLAPQLPFPNQHHHGDEQNHVNIFPRHRRMQQRQFPVHNHDR